MGYMELIDLLVLVLLTTVIQLQMLRKIEWNRKIIVKDDKMRIGKENTCFKVLHRLSYCLSDQ
jgi:hypothetical protein